MLYRKYCITLKAKVMIPIEQKAPPGDRTAAEWNDVAGDPPVRESYFSKTLMSEPVILNAAPTIVATPVGIAFSSNKREAL